MYTGIYFDGIMNVITTTTATLISFTIKEDETWSYLMIALRIFLKFLNGGG